MAKRFNEALTAFAANGNSEVVRGSSFLVCIGADGDSFGGATVKLKFDDTAGNTYTIYEDGVEVSFTSQDMKQLIFRGPVSLYAVVSGYSSGTIHVLIKGELEPGEIG